jgi:glycosyltransferase involved in cell wall biosynthesis
MGQDFELQPDTCPNTWHAAFLLPNLGLGGAERVVLDLARGFVARGARVDLVLMEQSGEFLAQVPEGVRVVSLDAPRLRSAVMPLRAYLKEARPQALVAAMWPLTTVAIMAAAGLKARPRTVVVDHAPLLAQYAPSAFQTLLLKLSVLASYRFADRIVTVCNGLSDEIAQLAALPRTRVETVYNPIPKPAAQTPAPALWPARPKKRIVSAGRLKPIKNYPLLVEAFAPLAREGEGAVLAILGEGSNRAAITDAAKRLGVANDVVLPGFTATPGDWFEGADLFVSASQYEGFGNVLVEAMHFGCSVVSSDCPYGPREVLGCGSWGTLVPTGDAAALTAAMRAALASPADPTKQVARADDFSLDRAVDAYWGVLFE